MIAFGVLGLYWIGANVFLRTSLGRSLLNQSPYAFLVAYDDAYSLIPGRVHVEKLSIRGRSSSTEWRLLVDRGDVDVSLFDLLRRRFHATRVRVDGAEFRVRLRLQPSDATPEIVAALPPIAGFDDPPLRDFGPEPAPITDAEYHLWTVQLDDVDVDHVRELWIQEERGVGDARVKGRWFFRPMRWLDVGPATAEVRNVDMTHGPSDPFALGLHGTLGVTIHPFDVSVPSGVDTLDHLSGTADLKGNLELSKAFGDVFHLDDVRFVRGGGPLDVHMIVDHGVLAPGTRMHNETAATQFVVAPFTFDVALVADLAVDADPRAEKGRAGVVTFRATNVDTSTSSGARAHVASITTRLESTSDSSLAFAHPYPFANAYVTSDFAGVEPAAIEPWMKMFGGAAQVDVPAGRARADAHVEVSLAERRGHGDMRFTIGGLEVTRGADRFEGAANGALVIASSSFDEKKIDLAGSWVALTDGTALVRGIEVRAPRLAVHVKEAMFAPSQPPKVEVAFDLARADVAQLRAMGALFATASPIKLTSGRAHVVDAKALIELPARVVTGTAIVIGERVGAQLGPVLATFDLRARVEHARWAWGANEVDVTNSDVVLTDLRATTVIDQKPMTVLAIAAISVASPKLSFSPKTSRGRIVASIPRVEVAHMHALGHFIPMPRGMTIDGGRATAQLQADVDLGARTAAGTCSISAHALEIHAGSKKVTSDVGVALKVKSGATGESLDFSGSTVTIDHGEATGGPHDWWARVDFPDAAMWWRGGAHLRASIHGRARDAEPASVLVSGETILPEWVTRVFKMNGVEATAELRAAPKAIELRSFLARGEGGAVRMEYETRDGDAQGAVLLQLGELDLGFGIGKGSGGVVLVDAQKWFDRRAVQLEARAAQ